MAAAPSRSSSSADRRRVNPEIPLITCPDCGRFKVLELVVQNNDNGNKGRVFYRCPGGGKRGRGCQFYRWEEEYLAELQAREQKNQVQEENKNTEEERICNLELKMNTLVDIVKEAVLLLKSIALVCVCGVMWNVYVGMRR